MDSHEIVSARERASQQVKQICSEYGIYGNLVYYQPTQIPESDRNRMYIMAGFDSSLLNSPLPGKFYPEDIVRRQARNCKLFYPHLWALDLSDVNNDMKAFEQLVEYCKKAEFLEAIYAEYGLEPPNKIRVSELNQLISFHDTLHSHIVDAKTREKCKKDLDWFFKRERSTGFRRRWLDYFRSEHFPDDKGPIAKLRGYFNRNSQQTSIKQMLEVNEDLHKLQMQEHEFKLFEKFMHEVYPEVTYHVSGKDVVDHGGVNAKGAEELDGFSARRVTGEEYAVIRKEKFAEDGWEAMESITPAYWEFRDVHFKACDEPLVAAAYNSITLQYAQCDPLGDLDNLSPLHLADVPVTDFMNFVSLAKEHKLRFYIDNIGDYSIPSLDYVHVIYNEHQAGKLQGILDRMMGDKVEHSHVLNQTPSHPQLSHVIENVKQLHPAALKCDHIMVPEQERD